MYPHSITIINRFDNRGRVEHYHRVVLGVHYQDKQGVRLGSTDHFTDDQGYVQIPYESLQDYVPYQQWRELQDKSSKWTIQREDFIVKGIVTETNVSKIKEKR